MTDDSLNQRPSVDGSLDLQGYRLLGPELKLAVFMLFGQCLDFAARHPPHLLKYALPDLVYRFGAVDDSTCGQIQVT